MLSPLTPVPLYQKMFKSSLEVAFLAPTGAQGERISSVRLSVCPSVRPSVSLCVRHIIQERKRELNDFRPQPSINPIISASLGPKNDPLDPSSQNN